LMAVLVTTVIIAGSLWMMKPATLPIKQVHIEGEFLRLDTNRMQELVSDKVRGGFFNINVTAIRNTLMALPWVKEVSVHRIWPDGLRVVVNEQTAVVRWNETGLLNDQGHYFAPEKDSFPDGLPMLEGPDDSQKLLLERFNLLKQLYGLSVVHLRLNERRAWQFELDSGLRVVLGRKYFESRIDRFMHMVIKNMGEKLSQAKEIDMRYTNGFAVRWKQRAIENIESGVN
ncbi:MAG: cell division protein FtsQ/DivIB, partial [Proteobacteria bacterium]|nr:cell division protein FtsQ/DivIB [Pseudomonadota bacterium]